MRLAVQTALLFSLVGCAAQDDPSWHADATFTDEERTAIIEGAGAIAARTGGEHFRIVFDGNHDAARNIFRAPMMLEAWGSYGSYMNSTITLEPDLPPATLSSVVMHELGHAYGLPHHDSVGVMSVTFTGPDWTEADVKVCQRAGLCR